MSPVRRVLGALGVIVGIGLLPMTGLAAIDPFPPSVPRTPSPIVLPPLECDTTPDSYVDGLFALGFTPDGFGGIADQYGEALISPDGRVIVTFQC